MTQPIDPDRRTMLFIRIGLSVVVLGVSLVIVLSQKLSSDYTKWAFGMIGLVVGYWLR
jgi:uncharacterized membrane protein